MRVSAKNLRKTFHDGERELTIIENLTFEFPNSGAVAIVGRSGIGKSTLLYMLGGLERPSSGGVSYDGTELSALSDTELSLFRGKNMGFIFQSHHLLAEFDALENVAMPLLVCGMSESEASRRANAMLERVGLTDRLHHRPGQLSGGEQQRVAIARAVVSQPRLVLADEPTGNLDFTTARQVQELLLSLQRELANSMIIVTHNLELAHSLDCSYEMLPGGTLQKA